MTAADPLDRAEAAPEEAPAVEVPDPEAAVEDAVPVAGKFTAPLGFARLVPAPGVCAAFCAAAASDFASAVVSVVVSVDDWASVASSLASTVDESSPPEQATSSTRHSALDMLAS